jgi:hypothetical protein
VPRALLRLRAASRRTGRTRTSTGGRHCSSEREVQLQQQLWRRRGKRSNSS